MAASSAARTSASCDSKYRKSERRLMLDPSAIWSIVSDRPWAASSDRVTAMARDRTKSVFVADASVVDMPGTVAAARPTGT